MGQNVTDTIKFHSPLLFTIVVDRNNLEEKEGFALAHGLRSQPNTVGAWILAVGDGYIPQGGS